MPRNKDIIRVERTRIIDPAVPAVQQKEYTCGPTVLQAIFAKYGRDISQDEIAHDAGTTEQGTNDAGMLLAIEKQGLTATPQHASMEVLYEELKNGNSVILCITAYGCSHWVALIGQSRRNWFFADPATEGGIGYIPKLDFHRRWSHRRAIVVSGVPRRNSLTTLPAQRIPE